MFSLIWQQVQFCADHPGVSRLRDIDLCRVSPRWTSWSCPPIDLSVPPGSHCCLFCTLPTPPSSFSGRPTLLATVNISAVDLFKPLRFSNLPKSILLSSLECQPKRSFTLLQFLLLFFLFYTSIRAVVQRDLEQTSNKDHDLLEYVPLFCSILSTHIIRWLYFSTQRAFGWVSTSFVIRQHDIHTFLRCNNKQKTVLSACEHFIVVFVLSFLYQGKLGSTFLCHVLVSSWTPC